MAMPIVTHRPIQCDVLSASYRAVGKILTPSTGLTGLWNNSMNSYTEMEDATLSRMHMPTRDTEHYDIVRLVKNHVIVICVSRREDLGPSAVARGGFTKSLPYPVFITTPVYEISGTLEWAGRFDFTSIMAEGTRDFIPVYNCLIRAVLIPNIVIQSPAALFNRKQVEMLALANLRPAERPPEELNQL